MPNESSPDDFALLPDVSEQPPKLQPFGRTELIDCPDCGRGNAPNRTACIYCGAGLAGSELVTAPQTSTGETPADCGLVLVATNNEEFSAHQLEQLSSISALDCPVLKSSVDAGGPVPLARPETPEQAEAWSRQLSSIGVTVVTISDDQVRDSNQVMTIRGLEFGEDSITAKSKDEVAGPTALAQVLLLVTGRLVQNRVEVEERRTRREAKPVESRQFVTDESVLDIYLSGQPAAWRIYANTFDFSCLGAEKGLTAFENFAALINLLRNRLPNVCFDDSYYRKRALLQTVWPIEKIDKSELRLAARGKVNFANITTSDNEAQFSKYSALAWWLRSRLTETAQ